MFFTVAQHALYLNLKLCESKAMHTLKIPSFMPIRKTFRYITNTCYSPLSLEIGGAQFPSVIEIAPKSPFLCTNRIRFSLPAQNLSGI